MWYVDDDELGAASEGSPDIHARFLGCNASHVKRNVQSDKPRVQFKSKAIDPTIGLSLFGTVPPPSKLSIEQVSTIASCVAEAIRSIQPDGFIVYDIQDEPSRNGTERPFPFFNTHEPRMYAHQLESLAPNSEAIIYRAMTPNQSLEEFSSWVSETVSEYNGKNMVLVGGCRHQANSLLSVQEAAQAISEKAPGVFLGGITIPERHRDRRDEHTRISEKVDQGVGFFTSQVVYNADNAIWMLRDYDENCKEQNKQPARIVFTFAPFGSESTVQFLRWLGVELPDGTVKRVLSRPNLRARVEESLEICWENWKRILDASKRLKIKVPIGFSVESVSKSKMEQDAAVELFSMLKEQMDDYYQTRK